MTRDRSPLDRVADALTLLMVTLLFGVSAMTLSALGIAYDQAGGSFLQKFHPATYVACLALAARFFGRASPFAWLAEQTERFPGATYFVTTWIAMIVFAVLVQKTPISPLIDPSCAVSPSSFSTRTRTSGHARPCASRCMPSCSSMPASA